MKRIPAAFLSSAALAACVLLSTAHAQQGITLQLPTYSRFTVATTVVVPDRGGAYLGGVNRARSGQNHFSGPFGGNRGFGDQRQTGGMHVQAYIHRFDELEWAPPTSAPPHSTGPLVQQLAEAQAAAKSVSQRSVAELEHHNAGREDAIQREAADYLRRAAEAQATGKISVARIYAQMALRRAQGNLRDQAAAALAELDKPVAATGR